MSLNTTEDNINKIRFFLYEDLIDAYTANNQQNVIRMFARDVMHSFNNRFIYKTNGMYGIYCKHAEALGFKNNSYVFELDSKNCIVNIYRCDPHSLVKIDMVFKINLEKIEQEESKKEIVSNLVELVYSDAKDFVDSHLQAQYNKQEEIKILFLEDRIPLEASRKFKILKEYDTNIVNKQILNVLKFLKKKKAKEYIIAIERHVCRGNVIADLDNLGINYEIIEKEVTNLE
jgi:hypothetical protein